MVDYFAAEVTITVTDYDDKVKAVASDHCYYCIALKKLLVVDELVRPVDSWRTGRNPPLSCNIRLCPTRQQSKNDVSPL